MGFKTRKDGFCVDCFKPLPLSARHVRCAKCHQKEKDRQKAVYAARRAAGQCVRCGVDDVGDASLCPPCNEKQNARAQNTKHHIRYTRDDRERVFDHYGHTCACCREAEMLFLTIDHVNNDGAEHRRTIGRNLYRWLVRNHFPEGFQTLCYNCNCGKQRNHGVCPHVLMASLEQTAASVRCTE